jgi:cystathionine gamma-lyase
MKKETVTVRSGDSLFQDKLYSRDVVTPIHLSSTNTRDEIDKPGTFEYVRSGNPTRDALEYQFAKLENAKYGIAFASGMAAETALILALLKSGDHIISFSDLYGGTKRLIDKVFDKFNITASYVDLSKAEVVESSIRPSTRMIWIESPTNPMSLLADIAEISKIAHRHKIIVVVDNTFLTPYFQNPLDLGADVVVHSGTKYLGGHSDVLCGAVMLNDDTLYENIRFIHTSTGGVHAPFDSYLVLRGIKTLAVRMQAHQKNALTLAGFLEQHPKVSKVYYSGLPSHPQHALALKQARGFGGMISFEVKGGEAAVRKLFSKLKLFLLAESLGGVESLIEHPATMTHASMSKEEQMAAGITDSLIRMSVGIESIDDLLDDMKQGLDAL